MIDLLVIGGGPAGVAGAIQAHRSGLHTLLLERERIGGLIWNANLVENYPGLTRPLDGPAVAGLLEKQLERTGIPRKIAEVTALHRENDLFHADTGSETFSARGVLLATGSRPRPLELPGMEDARRAGLLEYDVCRLTGLAGTSHVLIIGGGDAAFDYALNCARQGARATILVRGTKPTCLTLLLERALASPAVTMLTSTKALSLAVHEANIKLTYKQEGVAEETRLTGTNLLAAVGRDPDVSLAEGLDPLRPGCYDNGSNPALYLAGDAARGRFRQMSIAVGDGVLAAMSAADQLKG